jgi:hypothetical protein
MSACSRRPFILADACRSTLAVVVVLVATAAQASDQAETGDRPAAHAVRTEVTLSPSGDRLGPITAGTPFSAAALQTLFPAATVREATGHTEGEAYPLLEVIEDQAVLLELRSADGSRVHSVEILAAARVGNLGVRHGATYAEVFGGEPRPNCVPGIEEQSGQVVCRAPSSGHVSLVFGGGWVGPDGELPPPEVLRDWTVERVIWQP